MRLLFSKDRAAQLDLLLRSLERNAEPEETTVIWRASTPEFEEGYALLFGGSARVEHQWMEQFFEDDVREALSMSDETVTFLCDDDVMYRYARTPVFGDHVLCFSFRLGANTTLCYPTGEPQAWPGVSWEWRQQTGDFGYPGSLDGHVYRTDDIRFMLSYQHFANPTQLEDVLTAACHDLAEERPLMVSYPHSSVVSVPVNRTSDQSTVRYGQKHPVTAGELNTRFLTGERLDLAALDFSDVTSAHQEVELRWQ